MAWSSFPSRCREAADLAVLLASQPVPAGKTRARIASNCGGGAAPHGACAEAGLVVASTGTQARSRLRDVLPAEASFGGPVDTTSAVSPEAFAQALHIAADDDGVALVIAVVVRSASLADLLPVLHRHPAAGPGHRGRAGPARGRPAAAGRGRGACGARYAYPEAAARALARAARYGSRRSRPAGTVPEFTDVRAADARTIVDSFLARMPGGGWLSAEEADGLLRCYGLPDGAVSRRAADTDSAVEAAAGLAVTW